MLLILPVLPVEAKDGIAALTVKPATGGGQEYSINIQVLLAMTALTFVPAAMIMMTSFMRIIIVLGILRHALGTAQTPTNQILLGLAFFMTLFIMAPVFSSVYDNALEPYTENRLSFNKALEQAEKPLRAFMLSQTRHNDLAMFSGMAGLAEDVELDKVPFRVIVPSFITSELKTAFQIGFIVFIPFLIIDLVVASVLMSMGMMMLSPMMISLPFKIMLFVMVDGWTLVMGTLANSFNA